MIYMFLSNNPSSGDIKSSNLPCSFLLLLKDYFTHNLTEKPFNTFANRADPDQAALVRAA